MSEQQPTTKPGPSYGDKGDVTEEHPAFGKVRVSRVSSQPGASLFDSEIRHTHYVTLEVQRADRTRSLSRDWIHSSGRPLMSIALSEAQWAGLVSSFNTEGVACTIRATETDWNIPEIPFSPRMAQSQAETRNAADRMYAKVKAALAAVEEKPTKANIRNLRNVVENASGNVEFAAQSLTEHAENVVEKARADIEAMVDQCARQIGLPASEAPRLGIEAAG